MIVDILNFSFVDFRTNDLLTYKDEYLRILRRISVFICYFFLLFKI